MRILKIIGWIILFLLALTGVIYLISEPVNNNAINNNTSQPATDLKTEDLVVGTGATVKSGDIVKVNYVGTLTDGIKFDSSYDRGEPFTFTLGQGSVIPGWELGLTNMKVGGKRKLTIPPELGYGTQGSGEVIPPNSTLIFEIELLGVVEAQPTNTVTGTQETQP